MGDTKNNGICFCPDNVGNCNIFKEELDEVIKTIFGNDNNFNMMSIYKMNITNTAKKYMYFHRYWTLNGIDKYRHVKWINFKCKMCEVIEHHNIDTCVFWHPLEEVTRGKIPLREYEKTYENFKHLDAVVELMYEHM